MNERIQHLILAAGFPKFDKMYVVSDGEELEKFAELIVGECINKVRSRQMFGIEDKHNIHHAFDLLVYDLQSHFGVDQ